MKFMRVLFVLWFGLCGCRAATNPVSGPTSPAAIAPTPTDAFSAAHSSGNSPSPTDVMGAPSDHSDSQTGVCGDLEKMKKEYEDTALRIPDCFTASVGPTPPGTQNPNYYDPLPQWIDNRWNYDLTLLIQALYADKADGESWMDHRDLIRGPFVRLVFGKPLPGEQTNGVDWQMATYCDLPVIEQTLDEGLMAYNLKADYSTFKDMRVLVLLYYHPPKTATSALDYEPVTPSGFPYVPVSDPCRFQKMISSEEEYNQITAAPYTLQIASFPIDVDESKQPTFDYYILPEDEGLIDMDLFRLPRIKIAR